MLTAPDLRDVLRRYETMNRRHFRPPRSRRIRAYPCPAPLSPSSCSGQSTAPSQLYLRLLDGGWDTLLSVDPREPGRFDDTEDALGMFGIQLGWQAIEAANLRIYTLDRLIQPEGSFD